MEALILVISVPQRNTIPSRDRPVELVTFRRADLKVHSVTVFTVVAMEAIGPV